MRAALIDYGSGNLASAAKALTRVAGDTGHEIVTTADPEIVRDAERIVLPGVGAFADCMRGLNAIPGMVSTLREKVLLDGTPFLGICVGMQLMAERGLEHGEHAGLGWLQGNVVALTPEGVDSPGGIGFRVPHMGWNDLNIAAVSHPVFAGIPAGGHAYFVHSYHMQCHNPGHVLATVAYGQTVTAVVGRDNIVGTQFHPEKSQDMGLRFIANFLAWRP